MPEETMDDMPGERALQFLREQREGRLVSELESALREVVERVRETNKVGTLKLVLKIRPSGDGEGTYDVSDDVDTTLPKYSKRTSLFYGTPDCYLQRNDPRQQPFQFPARRVENAADSNAPGRKVE